MKYEEREIKVVIGASYGDEGKGLMTNCFCKNASDTGKRCLTVLHNGGAQRGHTVSLKNGTRHVFHHLSSGTFYGSDTYLADSFIINPLVFFDEHFKLMPHVEVFYSSKCKWSTPFDMMINQIAEDSRGDNRHGSCGFGIWETIVRYNNTKTVSFRKFISMDQTKKINYLKEIRDNYLPKRLAELNINEISDEWKETIEDERLIENFIEDCKYFDTHAIEETGFILKRYPFIVFEGAQGLLLSQDTGENEKHTTPSYTGAENPVRLIQTLTGKNNVEVCYVTRTYLTRHGAGPFKEECPKEEINPDMIDNTNVPNGYQGTLRYGKLDVDALTARIKADFKKFDFLPGTQISLAITHLNETLGMIPTEKGKISPCNIDIPKLYFSYNEYDAE